MSDITQGNLLPSRQYAEAEVVNKFALEGTGLNGLLVTLQTGAQDPATSIGGYGTASVGSAVTNVNSRRYLTTRRVRAAAAGDTKYNVLGFTLHTVAEFDENGQKLILLPQDRVFERGFVYSGQTVPVLTRGHINLKLSQVDGTPLPGYVGVPFSGGGGKIAAVNPATITGQGATYTGQSQILGKFTSTSGSAFGGYVEFKIEL